MKVLFITLALVACAFAAPQNQIQAEGPKCPIDDPLVRDMVAINLTLPPVIEITEGSTITDLIAEGLSTLRYSITLNAILLTANFEVTIPTVTGNATYQATGYLDARPFAQETIPSGNFTGSGVGKLTASGVAAKGSVTLMINIINNRVQITRLNIQEASFDKLEADLGQQFIIGGSPVDWAELSRTVKQNFDRDLAAHKAEIADKLREAANIIVGRYTLADLIDLIGNPPGDGEC